MLTVHAESILHMHKSLSTVSILGDFDVVNFRDVTTEDALENNTAIFEFEFDPLTNLDTSLGYDLRLTWSQVSGPSSGVIEAAHYRYYRQANAQLESVGHTGTYRLHVPLLFLGVGRLLVDLTVNILCINYGYRYSRNQCYNWQIRGTLDPLEISAVRG